MDITPWFSRRRPQLLALLRIIAGLLLLEHGAQKLYKLPIPFPGSLPPLLLAAGAAELTTGLCVTLGFAARPAALVGFILSAEMAIGYFVMQFPKGVWVGLSAGEASILSCAIFLYILAVGPGAWSIDGARGTERNMRDPSGDL